MPLKKSTSKKAISANIKELVKDNKKSGKEKGAGGKERPMKQIIAIAMNVKPKHEKKETPKKEKKEHKRKGYKD